MNKKNLLLLLIIPFMTSCSSRTQPDQIVSLQVQDRNGFSETISNKDRLNVYQNVDFLNAQPYQKVLRVYGKNNEGKSRSKLTSYHDNGSVWQYLEAVDGRANGRFLEWHENGKVKIEAHVIEGLADLSEKAQKSWLFDGESNVWDEEGNQIASFTYDRGYLHNEAKYFYSSGQVQKRIPYVHGIMQGTVTVYDKEGNLLEDITFQNGKKDGPAKGLWNKETSKYQEQYREGSLINAIYFSPEGGAVAEVENGRGTKAIFDE